MDDKRTLEKRYNPNNRHVHETLENSREKEMHNLCLNLERMLFSISFLDPSKSHQIAFMTFMIHIFCVLER